MKTAAFIAAVVLISACVSGAQPEPATPSVLPEVSEVEGLLQKYGLDYDVAAARSAAVAGLVEAADPLGLVLAAEEAEALRRDWQGGAYELGIDVDVTNGAARIASVRDGSAAAEAGLAAGETIEEIDGGPVASLGPADIRILLRADTDEPAALKVLDTNGVSREVTSKRDAVQLPAVADAEDLPLGMSYLRLNGLYARSGKDVVSALRGWAESGRAGVVLDLRGAAGGDLAAAADVANVFADSGSMVFALRDPQDQDIEVFRATAGLPLGIPAMILVDGETTGAAEALAAALAGSARGAMLIGTETSADPMVRELVPLSDGTFLYVATRRLVVADGTVYRGIEGVKPDILVTEADVPAVEYEPEPLADGKGAPTEEEKAARALRDRVRGDSTLRRAVDVLLGLKALNVRASKQAESTED